MKRRSAVLTAGWVMVLSAAVCSLSKSFTSTAVGLAISEGRMTLDDRVLPYFPDEAPAELGDSFGPTKQPQLTGKAE